MLYTKIYKSTYILWRMGMGIILKNSKLVFDELIGTSSFDDILKNSIRDYYTYGFKSYEQFTKGKKTIAERWKIFSKILDAQWELEKGKNGCNRITLRQMETTMHNPIDELYFLHNMGEIGDYLNYLFELDETASVRDGIDTLPAGVDEILSVEGKNGKQALELVNELEYAIISNWLYELKKGEKEVLPIRLNRQLNIWSAATRYGNASYRDKYKNLSNRTSMLQEYGILGNLKDNPDERNLWLEKQWKKYDSFSKKRFDRETSGTDYWFKSPLTMEKLIKSVSGEILSEEKEREFLEQFSTMCCFFAQYYPLGEIGTMLAQRCSYKVQGKEIFKIRHNYVQKSLYDYNLIDILNAIEEKKICWIQYTHATNLNSFEEIIIPLEIRISVVNGREYVLYYHIKEQKIQALRLEFIDKITVYSYVEQIKCIKRAAQIEDEKIYKAPQEMECVELKQKELAQQLRIAEQMLPYIWGTDVTDCTVEKEWRRRLKTYRIEVSYDVIQELYIKNRLNKEGRKSVIREKESEGKRMLEIQCFPTKELRIWLRSFYKRIESVENIDTEEFTLLDDVNKMWKLYCEGELTEETNEEDMNVSGAEKTETGYQIIGKTLSESNGHAALFNELFSKYSIVLANAIMQYSTQPKVKLQDIMEKEIKNNFTYYTAEELSKAVEALIEYAKEKELINQAGKPRFIVQKEDYLYQLLPITKIECRWLLTVLNSPLAKLFIRDEQIVQLKEGLRSVPFYISEFPMEQINYFDRYNKEICEQQSQNEKAVAKSRYSKMENYFLEKIYQAMMSETKVGITYKNWKGEEKFTICAPACLEYSRRDDIFRIWHVDSEEEKIQKINVNRIRKIENQTIQKYSLQNEQQKILKIQDKTMKKIEIEFYEGTRNLPDRILTEFSVWRKKCTYDMKTRKYRMTLYYPELDEKEILIRLLSYGAYIKMIESEDGYIYNEIKQRIEKQKQLLTKK